MSLIDTIKIAKSMKRQIIHVDSSYMFGTDEDYCTMSIIIKDSEIPRAFTAKVNEIVPADKKDLYAAKNPMFWTRYVPLGDEVYIDSWGEVAYLQNLRAVYQDLNVLLDNSPIVYEEHDLQTNPQFMKDAKMTADAGMIIRYFADKYPFPCFYKVLAVNSTDKVNLIIRDVDAGSYLYEFDIQKKGYVVKEYLRCRKL